MQNPRVSLPYVGAREVCHRNTRRTTRTARFFSYTHVGKLNLPRKADRRRRLWPLRPVVSFTRDGADWSKVVAVGAQQPISYFFGFIQMRSTLSLNGEHLREAEIKSFRGHTKINEIRQWRTKWRLIKKKWSVLLVCTIVMVLQSQNGVKSPLNFERS